ncbi:MAG: hypothetical protein ACYDA4_04800 [Ignavibacteriaceae bacterium]
MTWSEIKENKLFFRQTKTKRIEYLPLAKTKGNGNGRKELYFEDPWLGWKPKGPTLIEDIKQGHYFKKVY